MRTLSLQSDGRIVVGGSFTSYNGVNSYHIARLHSDGVLDQSFSVSSGANDEVRAVLVLPDDKLLVGGLFTAFNGENAGRVARLDSNGAIDVSFAVGTGADDEVFCLGRRSDGRLFVGGRFSMFDGCYDKSIVRLLPEGDLDPGFNPGTGVNGGVFSVRKDADARVLLAGEFCMVNGQVRKRIARLNVDGSVDITFNAGAGPNGLIIPMEQLADGRWFVGGWFDHFDGDERRHIALLDENGALDQSFNTIEGASGPDAGVFALCMQPGQGLIAGGIFTGFGGFQRGGIVRLFMDGSVDASFAEQSGFSGYVVAIERLASGHLLVGGAFDSYDGFPRNSLAKLDPNGDLDLSFNPELDPGDMVTCLAEQSDGAILVGGQVGIAPGGTPGGIVRLLPDGSIDPVFGVGAGLGPNGPVMSMNLLPDGRIIIAGEFTEYDNEPRNGIARLNSDGTLDEGFNPGFGSADITSSVAVGDGVVIGGYFTSFDGVGRNRIARLRNSVVGVNEHEGNSNPLLYPNPSAGRFILRSAEQGEELDVRVHDMLGQEVAAYQYRGGELVMELGHLPSASYVVRWVGNNRNGCIPIMVAH